MNYFISILRLIEHITFVIIIAIISKEFNDTSNSSNIIFTMQIYILIVFICVVYTLYFYIVVYKSGKTLNIAMSRNRSLIRLKLFEEVEQMEKFGYIYNEKECMERCCCYKISKYKC